MNWIMLKAFLRSYWKPILVVVVILGLLARIGVLEVLLAKAEEKIVTLEAQLTTERLVTAGLSGQIERQNAAIESWKRTTEVNRKMYVAQLAAANKRAARLEVEAEEILTKDAPMDPLLYCEAADEILMEVTQ